MTERTGPEEDQELRARLRRGVVLPCPRCRTLMRLTPIPPRDDVAYVRNRVLLECDGCRWKVVLDR